MKKAILITTLILGAATGSFGQTEHVLDHNNVSAKIYDNGVFFEDSINSVASYIVPKSSNVSAIYSGSFWFGGIDVNGQLKIAAQQYATSGKDYFSGPNTRFSGGPQEWALAGNYFGQTVWTVSQAEIDDHIANYQSGGYVMPQDIANWPAHGDTTIGNTGWPGATGGMLGYLAPFVDVNNNGVYDPANGDYPCIKGDQATYTIMNDRGGLHTASYGDPVGIEVHCMFYQFSTVPGLENITFVDVEVVNMGTQTLYDTRAAFFVDGDLGNYQDDYVGTDVSRKLIYTYNGDNMDENNGGALGYGANPPAVGLMVLSHPLDHSISYSNSVAYPYADPEIASEFYNAMNGDWQDGTPQLDNLGDTSEYFYSGDPNTPNSWSEAELMNIPGDRRMLASTDLGVFTPDLSTGADQRLLMTYAIVFAQGTNNLNSVTELQSTADFVQNFYDNYTTNCFDFSVAGVEQPSEIEVGMYPNPNDGTFTLELGNATEGTVQIFDHIGRLVHETTINGGKTVLNTQLSAGVYQLKFSAENGFGTQKFIVR